MNEKAEPCRLFIEQTIDEAIEKGIPDEEAGREMFEFLTEHFDGTWKARSLAQAVRRKREKADLAKREAEAQAERSGPVTDVTKPKPYNKAEKTYLGRAINQAKYVIAFHRSNAGEMGPISDFDPAMDKARSAISYLREISPDEPKRLEALQSVRDYLQTQGVS